MSSFREFHSWTAETALLSLIMVHALIQIKPGASSMAAATTSLLDSTRFHAGPAMVREEKTVEPLL